MKQLLFLTLCASLLLLATAGAKPFSHYKPVFNYSDTTKPANAVDSTALDSTAVKDTSYSPGRVNVKGYYRKDGKYVAPYTRKAPTKKH